MIEFTISIINQTKSTLENFKLNVDRINNAIFSNSSTLHNQYSSAMMYLNDNIEKAKSEVELSYSIATENSQNMFKIDLKIGELKRELESIPKTEETSSARSALNREINDYMSLKSIINKKNNNLSSIRTQIGFEIDKFKKAISLITKAKKEFDEINYKLKTNVTDALKNIEAGIKLSENAYKTVSGVFTSCKVENSNVLVIYKNNLKNKYDALTQDRNAIIRNLNILNDSIKNIQFLETSSASMINISNALNNQINEFDKNLKLLNNYIITLKQYEQL